MLENENYRYLDVRNCKRKEKRRTDQFVMDIIITGYQKGGLKLR